jgi:alkylation response protein AidB-like acyl-CoA dehydrogenase
MTTSITAGTLPKEYEDLRDTVADFARTVVAPVSAKHDEEHSFPYEVVAKMGEMGLFGLPFPEEYGGMGGDYFALSLALEELGKGDWVINGTKQFITNSGTDITSLVTVTAVTGTVAGHSKRRQRSRR